MQPQGVQVLSNLLDRGMDRRLPSTRLVRCMALARGFQDATGLLQQIAAPS